MFPTPTPLPPVDLNQVPVTINPDDWRIWNFAPEAVGWWNRFADWALVAQWIVIIILVIIFVVLILNLVKSLRSEQD